MIMVNETSRIKIIEKLIAYIEGQSISPVQKQLLLSFVPQFYKNIPLEDLTSRTIEDLYGAVKSQLELMQIRRSDECKVRVYNPQLAKDHWQSTHTIVDLSYSDMPFLVDSMRVELNRMGFTTHLMINIGGLKVRRDANGQLLEVAPPGTNGADVVTEAAIHLEIDRQTDSKVHEEIQSNLLRILKDVTSSVSDWEAMRNKLFEIIDELSHADIPIDHKEIDEVVQFLRWLANDHFTFLGFRAYESVGDGEQKAMRLISHTGLGVLRDESSSKVLRYFTELPQKARELVLQPHLLIISKTNTKSTVHRLTYTDYVGIKRYNAKGEIIGEYRFLGLFTSEAYNSNPKHIPLLRKKVHEVIVKSSLPERGHGVKALANILATLPRDDLFQSSVDELYNLSMGILQLQERRRIRLFVRDDAYNRFVSCLVYVPRDNFNTELLLKMKDILQKAFNGIEVTFTTQFSSSILARIHFVIRINSKEPHSYNLQKIEDELVEVGRSWKDDLRDNLISKVGEEKGNRLIQRYINAFDAGYREAFRGGTVITDIEHIEKLSSENKLEMRFYRLVEAGQSSLHFKLYHLDTTVPLSDALPMLENMGLRVIREQPYQVNLSDGVIVWINDFSMEYRAATDISIEENQEIFQSTFKAVWSLAAENDGFNRLVLRAHLNWREVMVLRAYAKYLRQTGFTFSQQYIEETLVANPVLAALLNQLFSLRFDPSQQCDEKMILALEDRIAKELDAVTNLDQDRILRRYLDVIRATLRTNYYQVDAAGASKPYLSFKLDPKRVPDLPLPLPMFEVFVYSPRFEGVHLRAGKVARGGIRWSDRREDFRTEVLGLMKAQQVKNVVIVPAGAKGGFVLKMLAADASREATMEEGIACYKNFIRGLLDLTDNLVGDDVVHPPSTIIYDENDPYFVVAADKGTATFSDIANQISKDYKFWLGDAFASGGSAGYDHKKMAITSRGAWESVKHHFQLLDYDMRTLPFSVIGIGDMSGDVFGNGMLLSENIKLVGAFNHANIFLDPNPDLQASYAERKRLFNLPRSTWEDYNPELISAGGGVYKRSAKSIQLSSQVKELLQVEKDVVTPPELIRALLKAPVDLIWNGGIGTYVKASSETNQEVGDRANDAVRINGEELRTRIVGEGGNLGWTQLGRIEYALQNGKINTDFIDNSGGVDCSDHEVNIKILLNEIVAKGDMTEQQRNELLIQMKDEVAALVIYNNYRQVRAITRAVYQSADYLTMYSRFINDQERAGKLDRQLEFLPSNKMIQERKASGSGLTRPEIAILQAYSKIILKEEILNSELVKDPYLKKYVESAFPDILVKRFPNELPHHRLHKEIVATQVSNMCVTDMGIIFVYQMQDETSMPIRTIVRSYAIAREIFAMPDLWELIDSLDYQVDPNVQIKMMIEVVRLVRRATRWFLHNRRPPLDITQNINYFLADVQKLYQTAPNLLYGTEKENFQLQMQQLVEAKVPEEIANKISLSKFIYSGLNIIEIAKSNQHDLNEVAKIYYQVAERLGLVWFRDLINTYPVETHWQVLARSTFKDELDSQERALTLSVLQYPASHAKDASTRIDQWMEAHHPLIERWQTLMADLRASTVIDSAMLSVAIKELADLSHVSLQD